MNLRILKKLSKQAVPVLVAKFGVDAGDILPANGEETCYAPANMEQRYVRRGFVEPGPLKGTPMLWRKSSYEYDEWSCEPAYCALQEFLFWKNFEPTGDDLCPALDPETAALTGGRELADVSNVKVA